MRTCFVVSFLVTCTVLCVLPLIHGTHNGVCYTQVTVYQLHYVVRSATTISHCGLFSWGRCTRTYYRSVAETTSTRTTRFGCCAGYSLHTPNSCKPVCNRPACKNGGTCTAPNACTCTSGWTGSGCRTDVNECTMETHYCDQICTNTPGSFTCRCNPGYTLSANGHTCIDVNECTMETHYCDQICTNTPGSFTCRCNPGYTLSADGHTCIENNECTDGSAECEEICHNTPGSYNCFCNLGYELAPDGYSCQDIDECSIGAHRCYQNCHNTIGSFVCGCSEGYILSSNGIVCLDNNECTLSSTNQCQQVCVNTPGSYNCECHPGYTLNHDGLTCDDNNECASSGANQCQHDCVNVPGSYLCECRHGYTLNNNGTTCSDINECNEHRCDQICYNTAGSYECSCYLGYRLNSDGTCSDINECQEGTHDCNQNCVNSFGSYTCDCNSGYVLDIDGHSCLDINECMIGAHECEQECNNVQGSHECACLPGYELNPDGYTCRDVDECSDGTDECDQNCDNVIGSYTCSCNTGWSLNSDGIHCDDVDECAHGVIGNITCNDRCINEPGHYRCDCSPGYTLQSDMTSCKDINECLVEVPLCEQRCVNSDGSFTCACNLGYRLGHDTSSCLGPPVNVALRPTGSRNCTLTWSPPVESGRSDESLSSYSIVCNSEQHLDFALSTRANVEDVQFVLIRLLPHNMYNCCLTAVTTVGTSPTVCVKATSLEEAPQSPPTAVKTTVNSPYDLTVMWGPPTIPNGVITVYLLYVTRENEQTNVYSVLGTTVPLMYPVHNLSPFELVKLNVSASTIAGEGPQSPEIQNRTAQTAPSPVVGIRAKVVSDTTITIEWDPPLSPYGRLIYYKVEVNHELSGFSFTANKHPSVARVTIVNGLSPFKPYMVTLYAATNVGESNPASILVYTEHGVPAIPSVSSVNRLTGQTATVSWVPLTPDETRGLLTGLWIAYDPLEGDECLPITMDSSNVLLITEDLMELSTANITGLEPSTKYCVAIQVSTSAGESGFSNTLELSLSPAVPLQILFQVVDDGCHTFLRAASEVMHNLIEMENVLAQELSDICGCEYSRDFIFNGTFMCGCSNEVIFDVTLLLSDEISVAEIPSTELCSRIVLTINGRSYEAQCSNSIMVDGSGKPQCIAVQPTSQQTGSSDKITTGGITGSFAALIIAVVAAFLVTICIVQLYRRSRCNKRNGPNNLINAEDDVADVRLVINPRGMQQDVGQEPPPVANVQGVQQDVGQGVQQVIGQGPPPVSNPQGVQQGVGQGVPLRNNRQGGIRDFGQILPTADNLQEASLDASEVQFDMPIAREPEHINPIMVGIGFENINFSGGEVPTIPSAVEGGAVPNYNPFANDVVRDAQAHQHEYYYNSFNGSEVQINPNAVQNVDNPLYIPSTELGAAQNELHRYEDVNVTDLNCFH